MFIRPLLNRFYGIRCSIFSFLDVILRRTEIPLPRYERKRSFSRSETGFTAFDVLFLELWRLVFLYERYRCQDKRSFTVFETGFEIMGENVHSSILKLVLQH